MVLEDLICIQKIETIFWASSKAEYWIQLFLELRRKELILI